jgi:hypothetical protein
MLRKDEVAYVEWDIGMTMYYCNDDYTTNSTPSTRVRNKRRVHRLRCPLSTSIRSRCHWLLLPVAAGRVETATAHTLYPDSSAKAESSLSYVVPPDR